MFNSVLNPQLFRGLERYYGVGDVEVVARGEAIQWQVIWSPVRWSNELRPRRQILHSGEEYKVRCRRCRDHRARLHINHRWGVFDPETHSRNLWLANCFNENCYSDYIAQTDLFDTIYAMPAQAASQIRVLEGLEVDTNSPLQKVRGPGPTWRLDELATKFPNHEAIEYLQGRGFDPVKIGKLWGAGFCVESSFPFAGGRIIIPIRKASVLVGWQARFVGDDVNGRSFNEARIPKYWTSPGFQRRRWAYNFEQAVKHSTVVVVEGPMDAWRVGPMALAALGKTISEPVVKLIVDAMKPHGTKAVVAVAFDAEPGSEQHAVERPKPHPTDKLVGQLLPAIAEFGGHVVPVWLPPTCDPGSMDRDDLRRLIRKAAAHAGAVARFGRPAKTS